MLDQPTDDDLPDDDPDVVAGMKRLAELRRGEAAVVDLVPRQNQS
jgi:hypothetical protein